MSDRSNADAGRALEGQPNVGADTGVAPLAPGSAIRGWIVELQPGCWLAPWDGDPGRTLVKASAEVFTTRAEASAALDRASDSREWTAPALVPVTWPNTEGSQPGGPAQRAGGR